jgi:hypothetical protein
LGAEAFTPITRISAQSFDKIVLNNNEQFLQCVASGKSYATLTKGRGSGRPAPFAQDAFLNTQ